MNNKRHIKQLQIEKQRFEYMKSITNQHQSDFGKFAIEQQAKSKRKWTFGIILLILAVLLGYWNDILNIYEVLVK